MTIDGAATGGLRPNARLGRYQILRRLAVGGMAELYLARHVAAGGYQKVLALKRVLPHLAEDQEFVRRFLNEARIAAGLDHSNIAHVIDFGTERGEHFMAMEYVHGRSASQLLQAFDRCALPLACALTIVRDVAAALHYAHERTGPDGRALGLVHRDVSPSNVLVSFDGDVKLVDFGIAKATADGNATRTGSIVGKLAYMAPEQLRGQRIDRRADVFALCTVAYELTTGVRCFYADGEFALINRVVASRFEKPSKVRPDFPSELERIIAKGLSASAEARFASARELQLAIEQFATKTGFALSRVELSDHMRQCFGHEDYPTTDVVPLPADDVGPVTTAKDPTVIRGQRRRALVGSVAAALVIGLGVGLVAPAWLEDDAHTAEREPGPDDAPAPVRPRAPEVTRGDLEADAPAKIESAPLPSASPSREEAARIETPAADAARTDTRARNSKTRRRRARAQPRPDADDLRDFTPPSRRGDG
jgi:hypothetical protein